jgi:hypothetical protein
MKTLIIINGVTGAIGSACLARFSREHDTAIIGLSRKAPDIDTFTKKGILPDTSLLCSIGDITQKSTGVRLTERIDKTRYKKIIYIHAVGVYPFEFDTAGNVSVSHDDDNDGIDDRVLHLSYDAFFAMTDVLKETGLEVKALILGSISDKFRPTVHTSWWTVMEKIKVRMKEITEKEENISYVVLNISSVICPHEMLTRPFVFQNTNADPRFWLMPHEVAERVHALVCSKKTGCIEDEIFHKADYYEDDHFSEEKFITRKMNELGFAK